MADTKFHTIGTHDVWLLTEDQSLEPHRGEWAALKNLAFEEVRGEFHVTGAELVSPILRFSGKASWKSTFGNFFKELEYNSEHGIWLNALRDCMFISP
jgi:hypothetical protein